MNQDEYKAEQSIQAMRDIWDRQFTLPKPAPRCSSSTGSFYTPMAEAQLILDTPGDPASDERPRRLPCRAPPLIDRRDLTLRRLYRRSLRRQRVSGHRDILRAGDAVEG